LSVAQLQFVPAQLSVIAGTGKGAANDTGDGGPALAATFNAPFGVAQDGSGTIYVADQDDNYVRKFTVGGNIYAFAGLPTDGGGAYSGDSGQATNAYLSQPIGLAVDASGNIYIGDFGYARVRKVVPSTGVITTYIGNGSGYYNGSTGPSTPIPGPAGLCFDPSGNLYIASTNASLIIKVTPSLVPSVFAGNFNGLPNGVAGYNGDNIAANTAEINFPNNVACDQAGNVYIADTNNNRIRKVAAGTGIITTVAGNGTGGYTGDGGPATSAEIYAWGVATDLAGDLFITSTPAGTSGATVRKVDTSGNITTVAGGGTGGSGGPATAMMFGGLGLTGVDNNGSLLIPSYDYGNQTDAVYSAGPSGFLQFGTVSVGTTSAPQTVTFENTGNAPLTLSQTTYTATGNFTVTGGTCAGLTTLASGATCTLTVTFTPPSATTYTGTIAVNSNGTLPAQTINLVGTGAAVATLALTPATVPFPSQTINTSSTPYGMLLQNTSSVPVTIAGITFGGANPSNFTQTNNCPTSLVAYASCTISVTFTPTAVQTYSATISVASSASNSPQTSTLTGTGTAVPLPAAVFNPTSLAFGNQAVGTTSNQMSFILSNPTSVTLNISSVTITGANPGAFSIFNNACGATLGPSSCTVIVTFTPPAVGAFSANVTFTDNATGSPQNVPLTGTGVGPQAVLTPTSLTFPSTTVGATSAAQTIQLSNPGGAPLILSGITVTGANANSFAQTNNCPLSLAAAATCTISVTFTPATATAGLTAARRRPQPSRAPALRFRRRRPC
jgi:sugar lactone lactonase YvrE